MYGSPDSLVDLLIVPTLAVFFGLLFWFLAWNRERNGASGTAWKVVSLLVLVGGLYAGAQAVWNLHNPALGAFYRETIWSRKVLYSHYAALAMPILAMAGVLVWGLIERRRARSYA
jgi:hypothetical protein